jgi:hypothetical protein
MQSYVLISLLRNGHEKLVYAYQSNVDMNKILTNCGREEVIP